MVKKYKVMKVQGVKMAVELKKDSLRPVYPAPAVAHKSSRDYDRKKVKKETRELLKGY